MKGRSISYHQIANSGSLAPSYLNLCQNSSPGVFQVVKSTTELLFPTLIKRMSFNADNFSLALFQKKLDEINVKIDALLDRDFRSSKHLMSLAFTHLEYHNYNDAYNGFKETLSKAIDAFSCAQNDLQVDNSSFNPLTNKTEKTFSPSYRTSLYFSILVL